MRQWRQVVCAAVVGLGAASIARAASEAIEIGPGNTSDLPKGKEADGIIGDFVLRNDVVIAVISGHQHERRANMSTFYGAENITPGCLYDLTLRADDNDQITYFAPAAARGPVSSVSVLSDGSNGRAVVRAYRSAASNGGLEVTHDYALDDGWQGVGVFSTYTNRGTKAVKIKPAPAWAGLTGTKTIDDITVGDAQDPFDKQAYASMALGIEGADASLAEFTLEPGASRKVVIALAVGRSPAEAFGVVRSLAGDTGRVNLTIKDAAGEPAVRAVIDMPAGNTTLPAYPDAEGRLSLRLAPGDRKLTVRDLGRPTLTRVVPTAAGSTTDLSLTLAAAAKARFTVVGADGAPIPCKVQFNGIDGTKTPNLGPALRAAGCDHQHHSANGRFEQQLPPGKYQVIITHGIEFDHVERTIEIQPGKTTEVHATLKRILDTRGWVSTDFHNHSTPSGDNYCGTDDRLINLAAEQIEFAPTTEHNRIYDWKPHIDKLGLSHELATVVGIELTGSGPHLNSFPHLITPYRQDNGAPKWNPDPRISALTLRFLKGAGPSRWVHLNHPSVGQFFRDRNNDGVTDGGFGRIEDYVDAAETWSTEILNFSPVANNRENRTFAWLQMLNQGRRMWCIAVSDAHSVFGNGVGGWRTYVKSSQDAPAEIDPKEIIRNAKAGHMVVTNGPFLEVQADDGTLPGGMTIAAGHIDLKIRVQCNTWTSIDKVVVLVNGRPGKGLTFTRNANADLFGTGVVQFDRTITVPLVEDAHIIVAAVSETATLETGFGRSPQSTMRPTAFSNPLYVDVDHNGWHPNRDTLGHPFLKTK